MTTQSRNPFTLRIGQLMTGFGAGCGIGVGVGYPIALGSIPILGEVLSSTSSAGSRAFGGVSHKAFGVLRKLGIKNLKAGVGCGVGIGHGFGIGISLKPGVSKQLVLSMQESLSTVATRFQKYLPAADEESPTSAEKLQHVDSISSSRVPGEETSGRAMGILQGDVSVGAVKPMEVNPGKALEFRQSEVAAVTASTEPPSTSPSSDEEVHLRQENEILRTLLRLQEVIEDLKAENAALWHVLGEQFEPGGNRAAIRLHRRSRKIEIVISDESQTQKSQSNCFDCKVSARRRR